MQSATLIMSNSSIFWKLLLFRDVTLLVLNVIAIFKDNLLMCTEIVIMFIIKDINDQLFYFDFIFCNSLSYKYLDCFICFWVQVFFSGHGIYLYDFHSLCVTAFFLFGLDIKNNRNCFCNKFIAEKVEKNYDLTFLYSKIK